MRVSIVGGGPAGLYSAMLLKRENPTADVVLYERNAPGDTFGFGVVFSDATLSDLQLADEPSHESLTKAAAHWDPIDVIFRDKQIRGRGNGFAAISRHTLLNILQERCKAVGVDLRFNTELTDVDSLLSADVVIAADGANSRLRQRFATKFGTTVTTEGSKYIWLGTPKLDEAFTFILVDTEWGPFLVNIYPHSNEMSTWVVECSPETWHSAGLDRVDATSLPPGVSDVDTIKLLQEMFFDYLDGHELVGNNSKWLDWTTVRNEHWAHDNVVLAGDAAHTAHYSIGSGTKLAMEDAIALAKAITLKKDLSDAFTEYEGERKLMVEGIQVAAEHSLTWFLRTGRYVQFDPLQLAYGLLTRSERVDYENLKRRDPMFIYAFDGWFAAQASGESAALRFAPAPAFAPLSLRDCVLSNRLVAIPAHDDAAPDGCPSAGYTTAAQTTSESGVAMTLIDRVAISALARIAPRDLGLYTQEHADRWQAILVDARDRVPSARFGIQLNHAGPRGSTKPRTVGTDLPLKDGWPLIAASPVPYTIASPVPTEADRTAMDRVKDEFTSAARKADEAGFDLLELQFGQGYLIGTFISPLTNRREDEHGGPLECRLKFPLDVLAAVRATWPASKPLSVSFTASDLVRGGLPVDEAIGAARQLADHGADLLHVTAGQTTIHADANYEPPYYAEWGDLIRNSTSVPTMIAGTIPTSSEANHVLARGHADLCILSPSPLMGEFACFIDRD